MSSSSQTGPQHYREAERLADLAHHFTYGDGGDPVAGGALAAEAQVHATLALTAATALASPVGGAIDHMTLHEGREWFKTLGVQEPDDATRPGIGGTS